MLKFRYAQTKIPTRNHQLEEFHSFFLTLHPGITKLEYYQITKSREFVYLLK